jgi:hypothetical protein
MNRDQGSAQLASLPRIPRRESNPYNSEQGGMGGWHMQINSAVGKKNKSKRTEFRDIAESKMQTHTYMGN